MYLSESINRVEQITGKKIKIYPADLTDKASLQVIFKEVRVPVVKLLLK